jgi:hypothetical protein
MKGPLEYVLFQFDDDRFIGEILPALIEIEQRGCVGLVDLVFIMKDESGNFTLVEVSELDEEDAPTFEPLIDKLLGMMTEEDVAMAADTLPENTYAAMALFEHRWAIGLHKALYATGGFMLDSAYINPQTQSEVILEITEMEVDDVR